MKYTSGPLRTGVLRGCSLKVLVCSLAQAPLELPLVQVCAPVVCVWWVGARRLSRHRSVRRLFSCCRVGHGTVSCGTAITVPTVPISLCVCELCASMRFCVLSVHAYMCICVCA